LVVIAWALAMTIFRSPAMSLLGRYAFNTQLPQAASILTLVGGVAGAMGPLAGNVILSWGPLVAFVVGSAVLLLAALALQLTKPNEAIADEGEQSDVTNAEPTGLSWQCLGLVFGAGVGVTFGFRTLMMLFSSVLNGQVVNANAGLILGCIFVSLALTAIPSGALAARLGNRRAMILGLSGLTLVCVLVSVVQVSSFAIALALSFGAAFSLVSNGTIPFALSMVPMPKAGLGTGIFFSGGAAASSLFSGVVQQLQALPLGMVAIAGVVGFLLAGICISSAPRRMAIVTSQG
ncbi:MAG: MFS transporter, partial [Cyanobacteria bacterium P01_H01_bin.152]